MANLGVIIGGLIGTISMFFLYYVFDNLLGPLSVPQTSPFYFDFKPWILVFAVLFLVIFIIGFFVGSGNDRY